MAEQVDTNADIWKSEKVARQFAEQAAERERQRREQLTLIARLLPYTADDEFTFVDLGAGTGAASRAILTEYPRARAILAEYSPQMTKEGERVMAAYRHEYVEFDMLDPDWSRLPPAQAAVSALSIHHLPDARKQAIFREIYRYLPAGGWYINYDPVRAPDEMLESIWERVNDRYDTEARYKRTHRTHDEQARYENHVRYMIPLAPQLDWLRAAGFQNVDVFWKRLDWVIYGGSKGLPGGDP